MQEALKRNALKESYAINKSIARTINSVVVLNFAWKGSYVATDRVISRYYIAKHAGKMLGGPQERF